MMKLWIILYTMGQATGALGPLPDIATMEDCIRVVETGEVPGCPKDDPKVQCKCEERIDHQSLRKEASPS